MERDLGEIFPCRHSRRSFHQDVIIWIHLMISIFVEDVRLLRLKGEASTRQGSDQPRRIGYKHNHQALRNIALQDDKLPGATIVPPL